MTESAIANPEAALFNTAAVVQRTGVPATTVRAWERRYGYPKPARDALDQRLYSERDIQAIRWLAEQTAQGVAISRAVEMLRAGYAHLPAARTGPTSGSRSFETVRQELGHALLDLNAEAARAVLAEAFTLFSVEDVCLHVFEPLLVEVGERWHAGELSVAEEHYVSAFIRTRLFSLLQAYDTAEHQGQLIVTGCAADEWHELGVLLVSVFLARRGHAVRYLGANLPLDALATIVARHQPAAIVLSAQSPESARNLVGAARVLTRGAHTRPLLFVGGQAFNSDAGLAPSIGAAYTGPDALAAAEQITQALRSGLPAASGQR